MSLSSFLLRSVWGKTLWDQRRSLLGWMAATAGVTFLIGSMWPSVQAQSDQFQELIETYPPALKALFSINEISTPAGFLQTQLFSATLPVLFLVYAISRGADLLAGEEERGALDVLVAHPLPRGGIVLQKAVALALGALALSVALLVGLAGVNAVYGMGIPFVHLLAAATLLGLLALGFGALALALGAFRGRKGFTAALTTAAAASAFLLATLGKLAEGAEGLRWASPFAHVLEAAPLVNGFSLGGALLLVALPLVLVPLAMWAFERRDLGA
ncbi:MAG TPA: ABC transporter permease subunit [Candidatus Thermoplasmatota archaeon]|nr:ABC transporter permease subunit [Candidatus Thermoplasmatota archaeon]